MSLLTRVIKAPVDIIITLIFWSYFLLGYILFYIPVLLLMMPFCSDRESMFQKLNFYFYHVFFILVQALTPGLTLKVSSEVKQIKSAVIIANHRSYLDPILLISLFPKHKTIVKGIFFKLPVMRWVMKSGGYIPFANSGESKELMMEGIQRMSDFFREGGVLFIFPEGHRSRNGELGHFQKGAFSIASKCGVPVDVLYINNTDRLFTPGKFFFNSCIQNCIAVEVLGCIVPENTAHSQARVMRDKAVQLFEQRVDK